MIRSKSSITTTPSNGPQKGKRIDSIAALLAKKKRKRSGSEVNVNDVAMQSTPNKKRKLSNNNTENILRSIKEENSKMANSEKIKTKNKKLTKRKKKNKKNKHKMSNNNLDGMGDIKMKQLKSGKSESGSP